MKKMIATVAAFALALGMTACGSTAASTAESVADAASTAESTAESVADAASTELDETTAALTDVIVGVQTGTTGDIYISGDADDGLLGSTTVERYNNGPEAVQALLGGKVDAVVIDNEPAKALVAANADALRILDSAYTEENYAICVSKDNADLTAEMNKAIAELKTDGTLDAILDKYINKTEGAEGYVTPEGTEYPNGKLVMATNAAFEPYEYKEGDAVVGIDAEFAKAICDKMGYELTIEDMAFDSIITAVQSGKADFGAAGMTVTEDRLQSIDFTDSYCTGIQSVIVKK